MKRNGNFGFKVLCRLALLGGMAGATFQLGAGELPVSVQRAVGSMIGNELEYGAFPGAAFVAGDRAGNSYAANYGFLDYAHATPVSDSTLYDLASCTKVLSTTFVCMRLYDEGRIRLDQQVGEFLPAFAETPVATITIQELLTHTSGLRFLPIYPLLVRSATGEPLLSGQRDDRYPYQVDKNLYMAAEVLLDTTYLSHTERPGYRQLADSLFLNPAFDTLLTRRIIDTYQPSRRGKHLYNDTNMYLLRLIAEQVSGRSLAEFTDALFAELGCRNTGYRPLEWASRGRIAPTEQDWLLRRGILQGYVHDELAAVSGGVGGNAGLFATAGDVARFCRMLLNDGMLEGRRILSKATIDRFTSSPLAKQGVWYGLGFDKRSPADTTFGGAESFGHTGFTGTILWIDRRRDLFMVFLSNRIHPTRANTRLQSSQLRQRLWNEMKNTRP